MRATAARRAAHAVLAAASGGALADRALAAALAEHRVPERDRGWTQELVYGALRLRGRLDWLLAQVVKGGLDRVDPPVLEALRLGAYQLLEMRSVPPHAAVSQSVELARGAAGEGAARFANGVLRALLRRGGELTFPEAPVERLVTWGSHPRWLVERWVARLGAAAAGALVEADNTRPPLYVRPLGIPPAEAMARLAAAGLGGRVVPLAPDAVEITAGTPAEVLAVLPAVVQDPAAGLVVRYAAPPPGGRVVDLCAAPGGKALGLAASLAAEVAADGGAEGRGTVVACDVSADRMARLAENLARVGGDLPVLPVVADGRRPPLAAADAVLVDAPCTGTGTLRRHPDGRWRIRPRDLAALATLQDELLDAAAGLLGPGGLLVYATCSLEPEENEERVDAFLRRHRGFRVAPAVAGLDPGLTDAGGRLRVEPWRHGLDGAFAARLVRID